MGLLAAPVIKKFLANKIESSRPEWGDYLLEVADVFSSFDGEDLDRDLIKERFSAMSGRSFDHWRDAENYRDEFGAYGTYLGVFRIEKIDGRWKVFLSNSAKHFLCSTVPDVESFCRVQMALFQYPNGAGATIQGGNSVRMQSNVRDDTVREIQHNIRINPLRLLCKVVVALHELGGIAFSDVEVTYRTLFMLMNDDRINQAFSPSESAIWTALSEYDAGTLPPWTSERGLLTNFKRNFHIFEWTGLFKRSHNGLIIANGDYEKTYAHIRTISQMAHNFQGFEPCYSQADIKQQMIDVVSSPKWGRYFDAFTMPVDTLVTLAGDEDLAGVAAFNDTAPIGTFDLGNQPFPPLSDFHSNQIRAFTQGANQIDPIETLVRREKANREHARILERLATLLRYHGHPASENVFIDLCSVTEGLEYIFEVKSNSEKNALSQIRKAIAQLYEYRYRSEKIGAVLCIVMQQKPRQDWVIDYLLNDREICICWMVDDVRLECPTQCHAALSRIGIV